MSVSGSGVHVLDESIDVIKALVDGRPHVVNAASEVDLDGPDEYPWYPNEG